MTMLQTEALTHTLINLLTELIAETRSHPTRVVITMNTTLDKDLQIDSLTRVEFYYRIEKQLGIHLPQSAMAEANTLGEILKIIQERKLIKPLTQFKIIPRPQVTEIDVSQAKTLIDVLQVYAELEPSRPHIYLQDEHGDEKTITYGDLLQQSTRVAAKLIELGLQPRETVAIMLPTSEDFFFAFIGVLLAGGIPTPIYPPFRPDQIEEYALREAKILQNAEVRLLITFGKAKRLSQLLRVFIPSLHTVTTVDHLLKSSLPFTPIQLQENFPAMIQYTSGSTGNPKGVLLTHANLLANIRAYGHDINVTEQDALVSWLPLYHDMGLIAAWLGSFYYGVTATIMSPLTFLSRPERWLWAIHYHRATISGAPNFAYELCIHRIEPKDIEGLDLSCWRLAFSGAEAVQPNTLKRFYKKFQAYGLKEESLTPVYGLAEATVGVAISALDEKPQIDRIQRQPFQEQNKAIPASDHDKDILEFVDCGKALIHHKIRVVDDKDQELLNREVGNLEVCGPSVMQGYFHNKTATENIRHNEWIRTGDQAYLVNGSLYITGRKKDVIIKAGRNLLPDGIEKAAEQVSGVRKGCVVAFGIHDARQGTEKLIVIVESSLTSLIEKSALRDAISETIITVVGIPPDQVEIVPPRSIPKTSSGKLRRAETKQLFLSNKLGRRITRQSVQVSRLVLRAFIHKISRLNAKIFRFLYTAYVGVITLVLLPFMYLTTYFANQMQTHRFMRRWMKILLTLVCGPIKVKNENILTQHIPAIYAANHASYIDSLVLLAVLPPGAIFVGKEEIQRTPVLKYFFRKLGYLAVEREDFNQSLADAEKIKRCLKQKNSIVIFPEATFQYSAGLRPFKIGAFKLAVDTQTGIIPIALKGTRAFMRGTSKLLRPTKITVTITEPIKPKRDDWDEVIQLQHQVREQILKHCGEQALCW